MKFNRPFADSVVLQNAADMTHVLRELAQEGYPLRRDETTQLSPHLRDHIKRSGDYVVDLDEVPGPLYGEMPALLDWFGSRAVQDTLVVRNGWISSVRRLLALRA